MPEITSDNADMLLEAFVNDAAQVRADGMLPARLPSWARGWWRSLVSSPTPTPVRPHLSFGPTPHGLSDAELLQRYRAAVAVYLAVGVPIHVVLYDWAPSHISTQAEADLADLLPPAAELPRRCVECNDAPVDACSNGRLCLSCHRRAATTEQEAL